jgi:hypothetical protein
MDPHNPVSQLQLKLMYQALAKSGAALPGLKEVGFKAFSQTDEDGMLLYIFSIIGVANKTCVEVCAGQQICSLIMDGTVCWWTGTRPMSGMVSYFTKEIPLPTYIHQRLSIPG